MQEIYIPEQKSIWNNRWPKLVEHLNESQFAKLCLTLSPDNSKNILDLGCGYVGDAIFFAKQGLNVTALDFSEPAVEMTVKRAHDEGLSNLIGVMQDMRYMDINSKFDIVYANMSLHYFRDSEFTKIIYNIHNLLKPEGKLFARVKSIKDPEYGIGKFVEDDMFLREDGRVMHYFSDDYMKKHLGDFRYFDVAYKLDNHITINMDVKKITLLEVIAEK